MEILNSRYKLLWNEIQKAKSETQFESNSKKKNHFPWYEETKNTFAATTSKKNFERKKEFTITSNLANKKLKFCN